MRTIITRGLYIVYPIYHFGLYWRVTYITDKSCTKNGNSSFVKPKIPTLYTRAFTDQEQVIVVHLRYITEFQIVKDDN